MAEDTMAKIKDKESELSGRFSRMDGDRALYLLENYVLRDDKNRKIPDVVNVTMPEPRMFAEKVFSIINSAHMQQRVEGRGLSDNETSIIENFLDDLLVSIDERLMAKGQRILKPFLIEQDCLRGTIASRNLLWEQPDGTFVPDVLQTDARYLTYDYDANGLAWAACKFFKTKTMLESEYPDASIGGAKDIEVVESWDKQKREVYAGGKKIHEEPNTLGYVPFVIVESATGPMLMDRDFMKYRGESIYATVRKLYPEINRHASILSTLDMLSFLGGWQYESQMGELAQKPEHPIRGIRKVVPVEKGGGYKPLPINDIRNASRMLQYLLLSALQRATFSNLEYGTLTMPLSAVAISKMMGTRDAIIMMRLHDLSLYYRQTSKMLIRQYVEGGIKAKLGVPGIEREYNPKDLEKNFAIWYDFTPTSPEQDIANTAVAQQQKALGMSWHSILTNTLKVQDVAQELAKEREEMADRMDVANVLYDQVFAYRDRGDSLKDRKEKEKYYLKSELMLQQLENILKQRAQGQTAGFNAEAGQPSGEAVKPMLPLMAGGGAGGAMPEREEEFSPDELEERAQGREVQVRKQTAEGS